MIDRIVVVTNKVQCFINLCLIAVDGRAMLHAVMCSWQEDTSTSTLNMLGFDVAVSFDKTKDNFFIRKVGAGTFITATDVCFVSFNDAR